MLSPKQIAAFQQEILVWYSKHQRDLPWRKTRDPYSIIVSEVMSQQTQIPRVVPKYVAWMERFPTLKDLAEAPTSEVLRYWSGLGYNRRALFLQKLAKEIVKNFDGVFPQDEKALRQLPGIGEYTAKALLCFAFDKQVPVIDTNIKKVIAVHFFEGQVPDKKILEQVAEELLPQGKAYEWNQALMDYAGAELKAHKIPIPKQSKFKDSDRYYRGQILKLLLEKQKLFEKDLTTIFAKDVGEERMKRILQSLEKDKFIKNEEGEIILS